MKIILRLRWLLFLAFMLARSVSAQQMFCCPGSIPGEACAEFTQQQCLAGGGTTFQTLEECKQFGCTEPKPSMSLYTKIRGMVESERGKTIDPTIAAFVAKAYEGTRTLTADNVKAAVEGNTSVACGGIDRSECESRIAGIRQVYEDEARILTLGRSLQTMVSGYELPLTLDTASLRRFWQMDTEKGAPSSRVKTIDAPALTPLIQAIGQLLTQLPEEQRTAAVWRYGGGVRLVAGERAPRFPAPTFGPGSGPGTERQFLSKRWTNLEQAMLALWNALPKDFDPPLAPEEGGSLVFPKEIIRAYFPDTITLWARSDGDAKGKHPFGDIGLGWTIPVEPVFPSLLSEEGEAILGGTYPPQLPEGRTLCTDPFGQRGYLCRPREEDRALCPPPGNADPAAITLTTCASDVPARQTTAGPDVCKDIMPAAEVCAPGKTHQYANTLGGTVCFLGKCVEESLERHRLTGGRIPAGTGDEAFPWDEPLLRSIPAPAITRTDISFPALPLYAPERLVQKLDREFCETIGLPPRIPPTRCRLDTDRRLLLPLSDFYANAESLQAQGAETALPQFLLKDMGGALGARIGAELYGDYLRKAMPAFAQSIRTATDLMKEIGETRFPSEMCPLGPGLPSAP